MIQLTTRLFCLATFAVGIALAASPQEITLFDNVTAGRTPLKAGHYTVEMQGGKAVFKTGKKTIEIPANLVKGDQTYTSTAISSQHSKLMEIDLRGTQDKIVFDTDVART